MIGGDRVRDMHLKQQYTGADPCKQDANSVGPQTPKSHTDNVHTPNNRSNNTTGAPAQPSLRYYGTSGIAPWSWSSYLLQRADSNL